MPKSIFNFFYLQKSNSGKNFAKTAKLVIVALRLLDSSVAQLTYKKRGGGGGGAETQPSAPCPVSHSRSSLLQPRTAVSARA